MKRVVITFGTFDVFHFGHLKMLERASRYGARLFVGVSSDLLNIEKKGREPVYPQYERMEILRALTVVHHVFSEDSLDKKRYYLLHYKADIMVMGDDWEGKFDHFKDLCEVVYLPRTPSVSTTAIIEKIQSK